MNTEGSYTCECNSGYSGDGVTCADLDECANGACDANAQCLNTEGSFECSCNVGYSGDGLTCDDINECAIGEGPCDANAQCSNTDGSFTCECNAGYSGDGLTCDDIDECADAPCGANADCINTDGSFECQCSSGYKGDGYSCIEEWIITGVDTAWETNFDNAGWSTVPSGALITGFERSGSMDGGDYGIYHLEKAHYIMSQWTDSCVEEDYWMHEWDNNDRWVTCPTGTAINGLYRGNSGEEGRLHNIEYGKCCKGVTSECMEVGVEAELDNPGLASCPLGYALNGMYRGGCDDLHCLEKFHCCKVIPYMPTAAPTESPTDDVDECADGTDDCDVNATCMNTEGSYTCECNSGYSGDGVTCADLDECANGACDANAQCLNTEGSFECSCNVGYSGDGLTCDDINECAIGEGPCDANAQCSNTDGSFTCECNAGYSGDGLTCDDIDECADAPCGANADCINTDGSFECQCSSGYKGDGYSCIEEWIITGVDTAWETNFDNAGWSTVPSGALITGFERSGSMDGGNYGIYHLEKAHYIMSQWTDSCTDVDYWMHEWDNNDRWVYCPDGTAINGLYRGNSGEEGRLHNIEYGRCCKGVTSECMEVGVEAELDNPGLASCPATYALNGMYRGSCDDLHCLEKFYCCKVIGYLPTAFPTQKPTDSPTTLAPTPTEDCTVTEWMCVLYGSRTIVARINNGEVECMEKPSATKDGQCYWNADCENLRPVDTTDNLWTMDQLCTMRNNCENKCKGGWCKAVKDTFENDPEYSSSCAEDEPTAIDTTLVPLEDVTTCETEWRCVPRGDKVIVARLNHGEVECMERPNPTQDGQCYWNAACDETARPLKTTDSFFTMDDLCEIRGTCPSNCNGGWCLTVKETFMEDPNFAICAPFDITTCATEWRCVPRGDDIIVARLNHGEVECMERPNSKKDGQCYWNAECDDNMRPLTVTDNFWTMDQLCEIAGNCPARCNGGWCKVVKDTFMNDPDYSYCEAEQL